MKFLIAQKPIIVLFYLQISLIALLAIFSILDLTIESLEFGAFFFSIIMGSIGASVSIMKRIRKNDARFVAEYRSLELWAILMPIIYGTLLSGVGYLFFMSGILSGEEDNGLLTSNLFPAFTDLSKSEDGLIQEFRAIKPSGIRETGKLLIWSFISGYSEHFVIKILGQLEKN